jgi:aldose 1-epimerase
MMPIRQNETFGGNMERSDFGQLPDGRTVHVWLLGKSDGLRAKVMTFGGNINSLLVPGPEGFVNVILGHPTLDQYLAQGSCRSTITGRFANRIAGGRFLLDGREVQLDVNEPPNTLHGGRLGFGHVLWEAEPEGDALVLRYRSADGDQGFPGTLDTEVRYSLAVDGLVIDYNARTDAPTVINLTNHAYFNLSGASDILDHVLTIPAKCFVVVDRQAIPTGELRPVADTPFDFRTPRRIGERIDDHDEQLAVGGGYDHTYVLAAGPAEQPILAARLEAGGLVMETLTTEPSIQFYSGNFIKGPLFMRRAALCLETQHFPDSPNQPAFPSTVLRPGETFRSRTIYRFGES